jgi:hypothetical protein
MIYFCDKMSQTPPEQYQKGIEYLKEFLPCNEDSKGLMTRLKEEQKRTRNWKYRGTSWEHRI